MDNNFLNFVEKLPNWLRYILALPAFIAGYLLTNIFVRFARGWVTNDETSFYFIFVEFAVESFAFFGALQCFYEFIPKNKFKFTLGLSVLIIVIAIISFTCTIIYSYQYSNYEFWKMIISIILDIIMIIYYNFMMFKKDYTVAVNSPGQLLVEE